MDAERLVDELAHAFTDRQLFLVGGSLRDRLLGRPHTDLDLATDATPDDTRQRVAALADSVWLVGEKFGTVGLLKDGVKAEITTFRADSYDGVTRKPQVAFGGDIQEDLARRDFTINALARNLHTGELLDPFGGQRDLRERLVRFVGDAPERIAEDPLRMLRAVRFCARLGFDLDPGSAAAIARSGEELHRISWERIRDELDGILLSPHPRDGLRLMLDLSLARHVLPEMLTLQLPEPGRHHMKDVLEHTLDTVQYVAPEKLLRYAALLHDVAKSETYSMDDRGAHFYRHDALGAAKARAVLTRLRQPAAFVDRVARLIEDHLRVPFYSSEWSDSAVRRLVFEMGDQLEAAIALADADVRASDPSDYDEFQVRLRELRGRIEHVGEAVELARMRPLLNGEEVMALLGIEPGPRVGEVLRFLLDQQLEGKVRTREEAEEAVRGESGRRGR